MKYLYELVYNLSRREILSWVGTNHGKALFPPGRSRRATDACAHIDDTLHPIEPVESPCADIGDQLGYALRIRISLGLLHE